MYRNKQNRYILYISRCVLKSLEVDYATEGQFHTFREDDTGAAAITTTMSAFCRNRNNDKRNDRIRILICHTSIHSH